jgi:hypothetical protein
MAGLNPTSSEAGHFARVKESAVFFKIRTNELLKERKTLDGQSLGRQSPDADLCLKDAHPPEFVASKGMGIEADWSECRSRV